MNGNGLGSGNGLGNGNGLGLGNGNGLGLGNRDGLGNGNGLGLGLGNGLGNGLGLGLGNGNGLGLGNRLGNGNGLGLGFGARVLLLLLALAGCGTALADDPPFEVRVAADQTVELGATAAVSIAIVPGPGRTISADGPLRIAADAGLAIALPRRRYLRRDAADPAADAPRFDVRVKARQAGDHTLALDVRFWLCQVKTCRPIAVRRDVVIRVPAPSVDAGLDAPPPDAAPPDAGRVRPHVK